MSTAIGARGAGADAVGAGERDQVLGLLGDYAWLIDEARYDEWLALFAEDCVYRVIPRENLTFGLPGTLMSCDSKDMLRDRVAALTDANKYNIHVARHVIGVPRVTRVAADLLSVEAAYSVFQSDQEGEARLFSVGSYRDRVRVAGGRVLFTEKIVIVDSFAVPSLLATPL
jgi:anthranilate 1,2-dioxygenase small subunit